MSKYRLISVSALVSATLSMGLALPAVADTSFGGIIFTDMYYTNRNTANNSAGTISGSTPRAYSYNAGRVELPNISRIRVSWSNEDAVGLYTELGLGGSAGATGVGVRHAYGTYVLSPQWQLLAGHTSSPFSPLFPNQLIGNSASGSAAAPSAFGSISGNDRVGGNHNVGKGYGELDSGRSPQVRLTYTLPDQHGAIAIALIDANLGASINGKLEASTTTAPARASKMPRLDIGAAYNLANVRIFPGLSIQQQDYAGVGVNSGKTVTTSAASLGMQTAHGAFEFSGEVNFGKNWRNAGFSLGNSAAALGSGAYSYAPATTSASTRIASTKNTAFWIDLGYRMTTDNTQSVIHLVYGEMKSRADGVPAAQDFEHKSTMVGLSWPIDLPNIARGLTIRPEVFLYDEGRSRQGTNSVNYGKELNAGVQLQYTF